MSDYRYDRGHRVLRMVRKGSKRSTQPLAPPTVRAIDDYLTKVEHDPEGPLFLSSTDRRLPYTTTYERIRRLAATAGIPSAAQITPQSLRHTFITEARAAGVPLQDVQAAAGHQDPATTQR